MKKNNLYLPIRTGNDRFTMLLVSKMITIKGNIPSIEDIRLHIVSQHMGFTKEEKEFEPIQVKVSENAFELIKAEIRSKINSNLILEVNSFDLIMDSNTLPVIQIVKE